MHPLASLPTPPTRSPTMGKFIDMTGQKFGRLTVLSRVPKEQQCSSHVEWNVVCDCGNTKKAIGINLRRGKTTSCGCYSKQQLADSNTTHGMSGKSGNDHYGRWCGIKTRCHNPKFFAYPRYGGRGVTIHEPWISDFSAFKTWLDENLGPCPDGYSLDRIDNDGNYEPGNLRWADRTTQRANQAKPV